MNWLLHSLVWPQGAILSFADERITDPHRALIDYTTASDPLRQLPGLPASWYLIALLILGIILALIAGRSYLAGLLANQPAGELTFLELTFPADSSKAAFATQQLYALLHAPVAWSPWRLFAPPRLRYSLELYATRAGGIRYILAVPVKDAPGIQFSLLSYLPSLTTLEVPDYLPIGPFHVTGLTMSADLALPLKSQGDQATHDPISYITGQMAGLAPTELIAYQLVVSPITPATHPSLSRKFARLRDRISQGLPLAPVLDTGPSPLHPAIVGSVRILEHILVLSLHVARLMLHGTTSLAVAQAQTSPPELNKYEQRLSDLVLAKLDAPLFEVSLRLLAAGPLKRSLSRTTHLAAAFRLFTSPYQSLIPTHQTSSTAFARRQLPHRAPTAVLGAPELADLFHFPNTALTLSPGLTGSRSPELPLPTAFQNAAAPTDSLFGLSHHAGVTSDIRLPDHQRLRHTYVFGRTGAGKSTLLTRSIYDDIQAGRGVAVLDPHGDMFNHLLGIIPEHRLKDVVVFDPAERDWPIGLNLLSPGIKFQDDIEASDRITSAVIAVFAKLADEKFWGPRMEHILRNATLTALHTQDPNLFTLQKLLTDRDYQKQVATTLKDPVLKQFWDKEFARSGDFRLAAITAPLTQRLGQFITTGMSRHILLQKHSTLDIADIMDQGKILLVNLSKGALGEDQSSFFGTITTAIIWMAAYSRTHQPEDERRSFYVYVDEFQNFATRHFAEIASEGRKFHIALTLSHQSVAQITDPHILEIIAGNAGTIISFAGSPADEAFIQPFMDPVVKPGDIVNLDPHHFFVKTKDIPGADAFSGTTAPLSDLPAQYSKDSAEATAKRSRLTYGVHRGLLDHYFNSLFAQAEPEDKPEPAPHHTGRHYKAPGQHNPDTTPTVAPNSPRYAVSRKAKATPANREYVLGESTKSVPAGEDTLQ